MRNVQRFWRKTRRVRSLKRKKRIESKIESVLLQGTNEKVVNHSLQEIRNSLPSESSSCWCLDFKKHSLRIKGNVFDKNNRLHLGHILNIKQLQSEDNHSPRARHPGM